MGLNAFTLHQFIAKSPDEVWDFMTDFQGNAARWLIGVKFMKPTTPPPIGIGTCFKVEQRILGRDLVGVSEVSDWRPPKSFALIMEHRGFTVERTFTLDEVDNGTTIVMDVECHAKGVQNLFCAAPALFMKFRDNSRLSMLKQTLELGPIADDSF